MNTLSKREDAREGSRRLLLYGAASISTLNQSQGILNQLSPAENYGLPLIDADNAYEIFLFWLQAYGVAHTGCG
jgi:hypothetical protein